MDYKNDERYWNIKLLNKWFAISSILFFASIAWMFLDDNDDEFKTYQKKFRKLQTDITQQKLEDELDKVVDSRLEFERKYNDEKIIYDSYQDDLDSLDLLLIETNGIFYKTNMDYLFFKAEVDVLKYLYEKEIADSKHHDKEHYDDNHNKDHEDKLILDSQLDYENSLVKLNELKLNKEKVEKEISVIENDIKDKRTSLKLAEDNLNRFLKSVNLLENKIQ